MRLPKKVLENLEKAREERRIASVSEAIRMGALLVAYILGAVFDDEGENGGEDEDEDGEEERDEKHG